MKRALFLLSACLVLAACGEIRPTPPPKPHLAIDVTSLAQDAGALAAPHAVGLAAPAGDEPLVDERFMSLFLDQLLKKKHRRDDTKPDWLVLASHSLTPVEEALPVKKERETYWQDGSTRTVTRVRNGQTLTDIESTPGKWATREKSSGGGMRTVYDLKVSVRVYAAPLSPGALPLWEGSLMARQPQSDAQHWAPAFMRELAREFPSGGRAPTHRNVGLEP